MPKHDDHEPVGPPKQSRLKRWLWPIIVVGVIWHQQGQIGELRTKLDDAHSQAFENEHAIRGLRDMVHSHE